MNGKWSAGAAGNILGSPVQGKGDLNENKRHPCWVSFVTIFLSEAVHFSAWRGSALASL